MTSDDLVWLVPLLALLGLFLAFSSRRPLMLLFFILLPFPLALGGEQGSGNISAADAVLFILFLASLTRLNQVRLRMPAIFIASFLTIAAIGSVEIGTKDLVLGIGRMALVTLAPLIVFSSMTFSVQEAQSLITGFAFSSGVLGLATCVLAATSGIGAAMYPFGINKNAAGPIFGSAVVWLIVGLVNRQIPTRLMTAARVALIANSAGLLLTLSRGGWVGTACGLALVGIYTRRATYLLYILLIIVPTIVIAWSYLPEDRVEYATDFSPDSYVLKTRLDSMSLALDRFQESPLLGVGIGLRRTVEPHNVIILTLGESGILGTAAFVLMVSSALVLLVQELGREHDRGRWTFILGCLCVFTVYHVQTLVDVYWRRGVGALSWAGLGLVIALTSKPVSRSPRRRPRRSTPAYAAAMPDLT